MSFDRLISIVLLSTLGAASALAGPPLPAIETIHVDFSEIGVTLLSAGNGLQVFAQGIVLSYGSDWYTRKFAEGRYGFAHKSWPNFYLKAQVLGNSLFKVKARMGSEAPGFTAAHEDLTTFTMQVVGDGNVTVKSKPGVKASLAITPATSSFKLTADDFVFSNGEAWKLARLGRSVFHLGIEGTHVFWQLDALAKTVTLVNGGTFGTLATGDLQRLPFGVRVVRKATPAVGKRKGKGK